MKHFLHVLGGAVAALAITLAAAMPVIAGPTVEPRTEKKVTCTKTKTSCVKYRDCARYGVCDRPFVVGGKLYQHDYDSYPYALYVMRDEPGYPGPAVYGYRRPHYYNHRPYLGYSKYHGWKPYYGRAYVSENSTRCDLRGRFVYRGGTVEKDPVRIAHSVSTGNAGSAGAAGTGR
ncbi:hypothetical protein DB346_04630 [Verrucomicrobia bacterium LW23]|nr:hypothetical protein DB346_04630 [Verrucomicrobia bacterium LW23]